jgi:hypothetical protein
VIVKILRRRVLALRPQRADNIPPDRAEPILGAAEPHATAVLTAEAQVERGLRPRALERVVRSSPAARRRRRSGIRELLDEERMTGDRDRDPLTKAGGRVVEESVDRTAPRAVVAATADLDFEVERGA